MVIKPPPPNPDSARIKFSSVIFLAAAHPRQPSMNVTVETKKQTRRPNRSEKRPYSGWNAVLVMRYDVVSHDALFAASKEELIDA